MSATAMFRRLLPLAALALLLAACTGPSAQEFANLANSGATFSTQAPRVYDYAFREQLRADSADLIAERESSIRFDQPGDELAKQVEKRNEIFQQRLKSYKLMKQHAELLRRYFVTLAMLAGSEQSNQVARAADGVAGELRTLAPQINEVSIAGRSLGSLVTPITEFAVASMQNELLRRHLREHGPTVLEAIDLQGQMFRILLEFEEAEHARRRQRLAKAELAKPLADLKQELPPDWEQRRLSLLTSPPRRTPITAAIAAADELKANLRTLASGEEAALPRLAESIVMVGAMLQAFESAEEEVDE